MDLQAEVLRTIAQPRRLEILHRLADGPAEVHRIATDVGASPPNVSQHLAILRTAGLVEAERVGRTTVYRLSDPDVMVACNVMRAVLRRRLAHLARLSASDRVTDGLITDALVADGLVADGSMATQEDPRWMNR